MRWILWLIVILVVAACVLLYVQGSKSVKMAAPGLSDGALPPCGSKPNCVSSQAGTDAEHQVKPVLSSVSQVDWEKVVKAVESGGGVVHEQADNYLRATYTSQVFRFVDDLQLLFDASSGDLHVRSASRVGHSDMGANRKRVAKLRQLLNDASTD